MEILNLSSKNYSNIIGKVVKILKKDGVVVLPTDTVYGLMADATNKKAVGKIFKIKKRQKEKWLPLFVKDLKSAKNIAKIDKKQERLLKSVWPGKTTVVFKRKKGIKLYGVDKNTIAIRIPNYPLLNELLCKIKRPLVQTSANISGKKPLTNVKAIIKQFKKKPDLIIAVGKVKSAKPSRVINIIGSQIKILRK
ncbi:MAG: threonylcarbamoyl-AMP synthase [Candidatus Nealsonbacteria bacterium RBG_13_38_11]|uniref:L-threonylcarbamoyladenylate synthase n=1 Tax=Candidatus Nealsonbacteria bacterium RBG_13_38_11 TaxID=1801662 RepID=A0A1G2DZA5_9BACT|nr:MAG: threonylcarbamoyl-AMP synthase [Candidatus Nealsonbacteria bacterium RBG_13_38_11]